MYKVFKLTVGLTLGGGLLTPLTWLIGTPSLAWGLTTWPDIELGTLDRVGVSVVPLGRGGRGLVLALGLILLGSSGLEAIWVWWRPLGIPWGRWIWFIMGCNGFGRIWGAFWWTCFGGLLSCLTEWAVGLGIFRSFSLGPTWRGGGILWDSTAVFGITICLWSKRGPAWLLGTKRWARWAAIFE